MSASTHERLFVETFVIPEKRARYLEVLPNPKRRAEILSRWDQFFDFIPEHAFGVPRAPASELAQLLRRRGAGGVGHVMGNCASEGRELPLEAAIESALDSGWGAVVSCIPGKLALFIEQFPPGNAFILSSHARAV